MTEESEPLTTAQVIEHLDHVQDVVRDEIKFPAKFLTEDHWQMIANALDRLRALDTANGKLGQRATAAEHNCASARALAEQSLKRWVALEARNAELEAVQKPKPMSEALMDGTTILVFQEQWVLSRWSGDAWVLCPGGFKLHPECWVSLPDQGSKCTEKD